MVKSTFDISAPFETLPVPIASFTLSSIVVDLLVRLIIFVLAVDEVVPAFVTLNPASSNILVTFAKFELTPDPF